MLSDVIASERTFNIGGHDWRVSMMGFLAFHAELEIHIVHEMSERLAAMATSVPKEISEGWYQKAYDQCKQGIPMFEVAQWTVSTGGFARSFWLAIRKHQPDITFDQVREFLYRIGTDELAKARDAIEFAKGMELNPSQGATGSPQTNGAENQSTGRQLSGV